MGTCDIPVIHGLEATIKTPQGTAPALSWVTFPRMDGEDTAYPTHP
jgi:hypothetical protein